MPACFQLTRKGETGPTALQAVDEELCRHLGVEVHPKWWVDGWYDSIGFAIATGTALGSQELRDRVAGYPDQGRLPEILAYLEEHFTSDSWTEIGRR